jgi:hypothetical protein
MPAAASGRGSSLAHRDQARGRAVHRNDHHHLSLILPLRDRPLRVGRERRLPGGMGGRADGHPLAGDDCLDRLARDDPRALGGTQRDAVGVRPLQDGAAERVAGAVLHRGGKAEHGALRVGQGEEVRHARAPLGQRAGFVEGDGADPADDLQGSAALHQQTPPSADREAGGNGRGRREHQGTRTGNQQQRQAAVDPGVPVGVKEKRRRHGNQRRHGDRDPRVDGGEPLDEAGGGRLGLLRLLQQADDAGDSVIRGGPRHADLQRAGGVDAAREDGGTLGLRDRDGLAGHRALVHLGLAFGHLALGRDAVTRVNQDEVADLEAGGGHLPRRSVLDAQRGPRHQGAERLDARPRARPRRSRATRRR